VHPEDIINDGRESQGTNESFRGGIKTYRGKMMGLMTGCNPGGRPATRGKVEGKLLRRKKRPLETTTEKKLTMGKRVVHAPRTVPKELKKE